MEKMIDYGLAGGTILLFTLMAYFILKSVGSFFKDLVDPSANNGRGGILFQLAKGHLELIERLSSIQESLNQQLHLHIDESRSSYEQIDLLDNKSNKLVGVCLKYCDIIEVLCKRARVWDKEIQQHVESLRLIIGLQNGKGFNG